MMSLKSFVSVTYVRRHSSLDWRLVLREVVRLARAPDMEKVEYIARPVSNV